MSDFKPTLPKDFDVSKVQFNQMKTMPSGAKLVFMTYNGGPIYLQSPEMTVTFDPQVFSDDDKNCKYNVKASVNMSNEASKVFHDKMTEFDKMLRSAAIKNSVEWFKKKNVSDDVVDSMFNPTIKVSVDSETGEPNGRFPPTFGFKVKKRDGKIQCACFDGSGGSPPPEFNFNDKEADDYKDFEKCFKKNTLVKGLFKCEFVWHSPGKFGCSWSAQQLRIKVPKGFDEFAFVDDSDEEGGGEKLPDGNFVDTDSDEEGEVDRS